MNLFRSLLFIELTFPRAYAWIDHGRLMAADVSIPHGQDHEIDRLEILATIINHRFEIIKRLGSGSFGEVFLAKDLRTNSLCALKTERKDCKFPQLRIEQQIFLRMEICMHFLHRSFPKIIRRSICRHRLSIDTFLH